jgi:hypothetical protein
MRVLVDTNILLRSVQPNHPLKRKKNSARQPTGGSM